MLIHSSEMKGNMFTLVLNVCKVELSKLIICARLPAGSSLWEPGIGSLATNLA